LQDPIAALQYAQKYQKIEFYEPYEYQKEYFKLKDKTGKLARIRALMAGGS
jgi:hypothetical protein